MNFGYDYHEGVCDMCRRWRKDILIRNVRLREDEPAQMKFACMECANNWKYGNENHCVSCGAVVPEGRQVCPVCEKEAG